MLRMFKKDKGFPYLLPSIGPRADVQAVRPQVTIS